MKGYIYCCKAKPYLINFGKGKGGITTIDTKEMEIALKCNGFNKSEKDILNGKIVASFELNEVEILGAGRVENLGSMCKLNTCDTDKLYENLKKACLTTKEFCDYLKGNNGYAWHIDNLEILDKPMEITQFIKSVDYASTDSGYFETYECFNKAPQSWCYTAENDDGERDLIISIKPEGVAEILNGEKTIEIRKTYPKELENEILQILQM